MQKIAVFAAFWFAFAALPARAASLTTSERQRLVAHLEMTGSWLVDELSGLSPGQLQFRPSAGSWSILEVLDHLVVTEPIYWRDLSKSMQAPPSRRTRPGSDADVLWYGIDRTQLRSF